MQMEHLNEAAQCHDIGDPVSITRLLPLTPNTPASFFRPSLSSSLTPPLLLLLSAESQSSPLISTMLSVAGVSELFSGILITPRGARWPPMLGTQREMSSGGEPPTVATESGKLLSPQREGKVRTMGLIQAAIQRTKLQWEVSKMHVAHQLQFVITICLQRNVSTKIQIA